MEINISGHDYVFINPCFKRISRYMSQDNPLTLTELIFIEQYGEKNQGYALVVLPYTTMEHRTIVDSINKKIKGRKFYRGSRLNFQASFRSTLGIYRKPADYSKVQNISSKKRITRKNYNCLKEDATGVAIYARIT